MVQPDLESVDVPAGHEGGESVAEFMHKRHIEAEPAPRHARDAQQHGRRHDGQQKECRNAGGVGAGEAAEDRGPPMGSSVSEFSGGISHTLQRKR